MFSMTHAPASLVAHERMKAPHGHSWACASSLRPIFCEGSAIAAEDAPYKDSSAKPHKAAARRPYTSATENKDQCHHERTAALASFPQESMQNASSRCSTTSNHPRFK